MREGECKTHTHTLTLGSHVSIALCNEAGALWNRDGAHEVRAVLRVFRVRGECSEVPWSSGPHTKVPIVSHELSRFCIVPQHAVVVDVPMCVCIRRGGQRECERDTETLHIYIYIYTYSS